MALPAAMAARVVRAAQPQPQKSVLMQLLTLLLRLPQCLQLRLLPLLKLLHLQLLLLQQQHLLLLLQ